MQIADLMQRNKFWICTIGSAWLIFAFFMAIDSSYMLCDVALYCECARQLWEGGVPYVDFVEINPPLIMYLHLPVVWLTKMFGLSPFRSVQLLVMLLMLLSSLSMEYSLRCTKLGSVRWHRGAIQLIWVLSNFVVWYGLGLGQREHLLMLLYVPFFWLRVARYEGQRTSAYLDVLIGMAAGIGALIKPHYVLWIVANELVLLVHSRRWRSLVAIEVWGAVAMGVAYVVHWAFVPAAMREAFFSRWMPLTLEFYSAYDAPFSELFQQYYIRTKWMPLLLSMAAFFVGYRSCKSIRAPLWALSLGCIILSGIFYSQHKGWAYHLIPLFQSAFLVGTLLFFLSVDSVARNKESRSYYLAGLGHGLLLAALGILCFLPYGTPKLPKLVHDVLLANTLPNDRIICISTSAGLAFPAIVETRLIPSSRYLWDFPVAYFNRNRSITAAAAEEEIYPTWDETSPEEKRFLGELEEDILNNTPEFIMVDNSPTSQAIEGEFNMYSYLSSVGLISRAVEERYEPIETKFKGLVLLRRRDVPSRGRLEK